jgi:hypothetical protein
MTRLPVVRLSDPQRDAIRKFLKKRADGMAVIVMWVGLHFMSPSVGWREVAGVAILVCAGGLMQWRFDNESS